MRRSKRRRGKRLVTSVGRRAFLRISDTRGKPGVSRGARTGTYADGQFRASLRPLCSAGPRGQRTRLRCFCSPMCTGRSWLSGSAAQKRHNLKSAAQHLSDMRGWAAKKRTEKGKRRARIKAVQPNTPPQACFSLCCYFQSNQEIGTLPDELYTCVRACVCT